MMGRKSLSFNEEEATFDKTLDEDEVDKLVDEFDDKQDDVDEQFNNDEEFVDEADVDEANNEVPNDDVDEFVEVGLIEQLLT